MDLPLVPADATALVVIDLQKGITSVKSVPREPSEVVANAARLAEAFRSRSLPVFLVRVTPSPDRRDALHPAADLVLNPPTMAGPEWSELVPEMQRRDSDFVITKRQWGAFYGTELDLQLRRRHISTIVLCGISTDIGVESTARDAFERGYQLVFAEDAMASRSLDGHKHAIQEIFPRIGRVRSTSAILAAF